MDWPNKDGDKSRENAVVENKNVSRFYGTIMITFSGAKTKAERELDGGPA